MQKEDIKKMHEQASTVFNYAQKDVDYRESWRIFRIMSEFVEGFEFLATVQKEVTILGSARLHADDPYCKIAEELGTLLGKDNFAVLTGGGPGIMQASNKGTFEAGGQSYGVNIQLPFEQVLNPYVNHSTSFNYFFTRKVMLTSPASAFVVFPGGFGTMDELFEIVDLMDQGLMQKVPIVLVGKKFWSPLLKFLKESTVKLGAIKSEIMDSWVLVDSAKEAYKYIAPVKGQPSTCEMSPENFRCGNNIDWKIFRIMAELVEGFEFLNTIKNDVTVLGTKSTKVDKKYYDAAYELGQHLGGCGYTTVTGGSMGIAESVNRGAFEVGGTSIGLGMKIADKPFLNKFLTNSLSFIFPFTRKLIVTAPSHAFVFFPGGLGTLHQLFEVLTLMQTKKMPRRPVILFDHKFWEPLHTFVKEVLVHDVETIASEDDELYQIVDNVESIMHVIEEWRPPKTETSSKKKK
jgi:uncharacterized protein (TIGR00730 family)